MGKGSFFYVAFSFAVDSTLLSLHSHNNRFLIFNILSAYTIVEYTVFAFVLLTIIENRIFKGIITISSIAFYIFSITLYIVQIGVDNKSFDSLSASIEAILIVTFSVFYLFDQMNKPQVIFIYQEPPFWFVVGFIIYFSGTLFLFIQASDLDRDSRDDFWNINYFLTITKNILFAIAFSTEKQNIPYSDEHNFDD